MPQTVARKLAEDATIETSMLEAAISYLKEKTSRRSRAGEPAMLESYRTLAILEKTIEIRYGTRYS